MIKSGISLCRARLHKASLHKGGLGLLIVLFLLAGMPQAARAQSESAADTATDTVTDTGPEAVAVASGVEESSVRRAPDALKPPLPFSNPQVGPVIRRGNQDDVELRTTAFLPTAAVMDSLTDYDLPENEDRWIRIDISEQLLLAYEGDRVVRAFVVSTGRAQTPTVLGEYRIRMKVRAQTMTGGSTALGTYYNLPNVEWVQYFYADYGIHGTYWHNNFGEPMSHGCVNMTNADAKWLFDWAGPEWDGSTVWFSSTSDNPGTLVIVHE